MVIWNISFGCCFPGVSIEQTFFPLLQYKVGFTFLLHVCRCVFHPVKVIDILDLNTC